MKKNIIFVLTACFILVFLFSFSTLFSGCSASKDEKIDTVEETTEEIETAEETKEETTEEESTEETTAKEEESTEETTAKEEEAEAPTISLAIVYGPEYSPADEVCFYRVKATVTGKPKPVISFSKDDSNKAWGKDVAQVNLDNPADSYTLTATATNSAGSDTDSIEITWGCTIPEPPEPETETETVPVEAAEGGYIEQAGTIKHPHDSMFAGDSTANKLCRGFISFDISEFDDDIDIKEASLTMSPEQVWGDPTFMGSMWIEVVEWGSPPLVAADYNLGAVGIQSFTSPYITCTHSKLEEELQDAIDEGKSRFQLRIRYTTEVSDGDNQWDGWDYIMDEVELKITYTVD